MNAHWHVGFNNPGYLPDPDSCYVTHTPSDALGGLIDNLEALADEEVPDAQDAVDWLVPALQHFDEDGKVDLSNVTDVEVRRVLESLNVGELSSSVDGQVYWVRKCRENCADAA